MRKWNEMIYAYEPYNIPCGWNVKTYSDNMYEIINCACCGKEIKYGISFTSLKIHDERGFGYAVCKDCYKKEMGVEDD